jgi:hypothetical protein
VIGGEMEGQGLYYATESRVLQIAKPPLAKPDWIVVKGVCDWGAGKNVNGQQKIEDQNLAARNAYEFVFYVIEHGRLVEPKKGTSAGPSSGEILSGKKIILIRGHNNVVGNHNIVNYSFPVPPDRGKQLAEMIKILYVTHLKFLKVIDVRLTLARSTNH